MLRQVNRRIGRAGREKLALSVGLIQVENFHVRRCVVVRQNYYLNKFNSEWKSFPFLFPVLVPLPPLFHVHQMSAYSFHIKLDIDTGLPSTMQNEGESHDRKLSYIHGTFLKVLHLLGLKFQLYIVLSLGMNTFLVF